MEGDIAAIFLTLEVAAISTLALLALGLPLAWWLSQTRSPLKTAIRALVALPLVLPPTVLGFYLLIFMGPSGFVGRITQALGLGLLPFTFPGLVLASVIYSVPFVVQPLYASFCAITQEVLDASATLGASPIDRFISVVLPLSRPGLLLATVLSFAHTVGEFGVVLMIGGNIPGVTRVVSIELYNHVEAQEYEAAHRLAALLVLFSFLTLLSLFSAIPSDRRSERE